MGRGLRTASGDYVLFLDDDDLALPEMVATMLHAARTLHADAVGSFRLATCAAAACRSRVLVNVDNRVGRPGRSEHHNVSAAGEWTFDHVALALGNSLALNVYQVRFRHAYMTGFRRR